MHDLRAGELKRGLENRHIQLIALGSAVGTGLFLGSADALALAGPATILGYALAGIITFLIMRQLGEMIVEEPVAGSFSHFAHKYWGDFPGFLSGWNYWVLFILVGMAELTAIGTYVQFWWPRIPTWCSAAAFFLLVNLINLAHVKLYGEMEFWFSLIKIVAILGMILFGGWLIASGNGGPQAGVANLWNDGGFFPEGVGGLIAALAVIMFSFGGLELIGITAAEARDPQKTIPRAINQVLYRILIFYIGALAVLLSLYPWRQALAGGSPFVLIFSRIGHETTAHVLNFVVLTAALSVYNSCVYCNSRMLYGLARQGNAPRAFLAVDRRGVPVAAIGVSALATFLCVLINYAIPGEALKFLMSLVVSALVINWAMISLAHLKFRARKTEEGIAPRFRSPWHPWSNCLCLAFLALILAVMVADGGKVMISVLLLPFWLLLLRGGYLYKNRRAANRPPENPAPGSGRGQT